MALGFLTGGTGTELVVLSRSDFDRINGDSTHRFRYVSDLKLLYLLCIICLSSIYLIIPVLSLSTEEIQALDQIRTDWSFMDRSWVGAPGNACETWVGWSCRQIDGETHVTEFHLDLGRIPPSNETLSASFNRLIHLEAISITAGLTGTLPSLFVLILFILYLLLSFIMLFILQSRRTWRTKSWEQMSTVKRTTHRIIFLVDMGFVSIIVTFIQLLVELTHWDTLIAQALPELFNGHLVGLGLWCFNPDFSELKNSLAGQLMIPFVLTLLFTTSIVTANLAWMGLRNLRCKQRFSSSRSNPFRGIQNATSDDESTVDILKDHMEAKSEAKRAKYPAMALITSVSLSIFQFFYFATALASVNFFFKQSQAHTNENYLLSEPWALYSEAETERRISIFSNIFVVAGFPLGFLSLVLYLRGRIYDPSIQPFFGSIPLRYKKGYIWWEVFQSTKKLLLAIIVRAVSVTSAYLPALLALTIGAFASLQLTLQPWKRRSENVLDSVGSLLLVFSMLTSGYTSSDIYAIRWTAVALDIVYVAAIIAIAIYSSVAEETPYQVLWNAMRHGHKSGNPSSPSVAEPYIPLLFQETEMLSEDGKDFDEPTSRNAPTSDAYLGPSY